MQQGKRLQGIVTTSSFLLPVATALCALIWLLANPVKDISSWLGMGFCALCTVLMVELNNTNLLIRVRTRMAGTTFMVLWTSCGFLHSFQMAHIAALCLLLCYHALMSAYQQYRSTGPVFIIYACLGSITLLVQPLGLLAIAFLFGLGYFRAVNLKSFLAGIIGFILPFWLASSLCYLLDRTDLILHYISDYAQWKPLQYQATSLPHWVAFGFLLVVAIPATVHFLRNNFQDKIKVRMFFYFTLWMELVLTLCTLIFPQHFPVLFMLLVLNCSPLIAHFLTLSGNKYSNYFFLIILILLVLLTIYTLWMPSYNFF